MQTIADAPRVPWLDTDARQRSDEVDNNEIGNIMVEQGILSDEQVVQVLNAQLDRAELFGRLTEEMFGISEQAVLDALSVQVARRSPQAALATETFDPQCLKLISAKDAWDRLVLPIRWEDGELLCATTIETLSAAIELLQSQLECGYHFTIAEMRPLEEFIANLYAYEGVEVADDSDAA